MDKIEIDGVAVLSLVEACKTFSTGLLLGLNQIVSHAVPLSDDLVSQQDFQVDYLRSLRNNDYDANTIGWFVSCPLSCYWNNTLIESLYNYQSTLPGAFVLLYDPAITSGLPFTALRLTPEFFKIYETKEFGKLKNMSFTEMYQALEITITNSYLLSAIIETVDVSDKFDLKEPNFTFKSQIPKSLCNKFQMDYSLLDVSSDHSVLEKTLELMCEGMDDLLNEQWRYSHWLRNMAKEQTRLSNANNRKKIEGSTGKIEQEITFSTQNIQKFASHEPLKLDSYIIANQIETFAHNMEDYIVSSMAKIKTL